MSHIVLVDDYKAFLRGLKLMVQEIPEVTTLALDLWDRPEDVFSILTEFCNATKN